MKAIFNRIRNSRVWTNRRGQDLVDYALLAGFLAVTAGALSPVVADGFSQIFSRIVSAVASASVQGSAM